MTTYRIDLDGHDTPALWRADSETDPAPHALAWTTARGNTVTSIDGGVVFRAAAAVLAPDVELIDAVAERRWAHSVPHVPWADVHPIAREFERTQVRASLAALQQHVIGEA